MLIERVTWQQRLGGLVSRLPFWPRPRKMEVMPPGYLTTKQAAERLGITLQAVQKLLERGRLPGERFGSVWMIREDDLKAFKPRKPGRPSKRGY